MQVSRRYFFAISILIGILFAAFILTESAKEILGDYETNSYAIDPDSISNRSDAIDTNQSDEYVVYFGRKSSEIEHIVRQWANYRKYSFSQTENASEIYNLASKKDKPVMILVEGSAINEKGINALSRANERGINIVFCDLPDIKTLVSSDDLLYLTGIIGVENSDQDIVGYHVLNNTLLGGEQYYVTTGLKTEEELLQMDMTLHMTWYTLANGTKMYMTGMLNQPDDPEKKIDAQYMPPVMWRHTLNSAYVFCVNGDYMKNLSGLGFLTTFVSETKDYDLYPIINSQSLVLANVPMFTDENYDAIFSIYERSAASLLRDVLWSGISTIAIRQNANITCMVSPQLDYSDNVLPTGDLVEHFNRQLRQQNAEAGISVSQKSNVSLTEKLSQDYNFYSDYMPKYQFQSAYIEDLDPVTTAEIIEGTGFNSVYSIIGDYSEENDLVEYVTNNAMFFNSTGDALKHTYSQDLLMRSVQTALGYSMITTDLENVIYPQDMEDEWQEVYDKMASNLGTYYNDFKKFKQCSASQATENTRVFLNTDIKQSRDDDVITLDINHNDTAYFLLRVKYEHVARMYGASYTKIDKNTYLITSIEDHIEIRMEPDNATKYN